MISNRILALTQVGAEWVLWLLLLLSVFSVGVMIERAVFFAARRLPALDDVARRLLAGDLAGAASAVGDHAGLEAAVVRAAVEAADGGPASVAEMVACTIRRERASYERGLGFLGTLGSNAPFLGLFGTVVGIIKAFADLGVGTARGAGATAVMAGLSEALVATAVGIFVAIPAVVAFNAFGRRLRAVTTRAEALAHAVASHLRKDDLRGAALADHEARRASLTSVNDVA